MRMFFLAFRTFGGLITQVMPFAAGVVLACSVTTAAQAASISVPTDEVRMIAFNKAVATVFVGNPLIADVTVVDAKHAFVLGKNFGTTNVVALDHDGNKISQTNITVFGREGSSVTVHRGTNQTTLACIGDRCETSPVPGDAKASFDTVTSQMDARQTLGVKAASN